MDDIVVIAIGRQFIELAIQREQLLQQLKQTAAQAQATADSQIRLAPRPAPEVEED